MALVHGLLTRRRLHTFLSRTSKDAHGRPGRAEALELRPHGARVGWRPDGGQARGNENLEPEPRRGRVHSGRKLLSLLASAVAVAVPVQERDSKIKQAAKSS